LSEVEHTVFVLFGACIDFLSDSELGIWTRWRSWCVPCWKDQSSDYV